jgi:transcriptional regulator with XRE-family HTH domain
MNCTIFSEKFNLLRKDKKISVYKIAQRLGTSASGVWKYAHNETTPSFENLIKLADLFDVSIDYLVGRTDEPEINKKV